MAPAATPDPADPATALGEGHGEGTAGPIPVSPEELNAWRRGFTPQAEIWNGRLAMLGLSVGLAVLLIARLAATHS
ncbi:MAG: high light inducible protein [Cyanobium sp.]